MNKEIPKIIYNIGFLRYGLTILINKNYRIKKITKEIVDKNKITKQIEIPGNYIITVSKKYIILTSYKNNKRKPIIVKPWKKNKTIYENNKKITPYTDIESYNWFHIFDEAGELITFFKDRKNEESNLIFYHLELS